MVAPTQQCLFEEAIETLDVLLVNDLCEDTEGVGFHHIVVRLLDVFA
jgi:hypothetical protein